jgi:hypothetical protein
MASCGGLEPAKAICDLVENSEGNKKSKRMNRPRHEYTQLRMLNKKDPSRELTSRLRHPSRSKPQSEMTRHDAALNLVFSLGSRYIIPSNPCQRFPYSSSFWSTEPLSLQAVEMNLINRTFPITLLLLISWHLAGAVPQRRVEKRQSGNLNFCYGNNSICAAESTLYDDCETYQDPYIEAKWFGCACANGYIAVEEA